MTDLHTVPAPSVWPVGIAATVLAAAANVGAGAAAYAAGVSFAGPDGKTIPVAAFGLFTVIFSLIGVALAAILARTAKHPRRLFVIITVVLLLLSFVPDLTFGFDWPTAFSLMGLHMLAALIVIPTLARRLADA